MTQGRDGISLAPRGARRLMGVTHRLSIVAAAFAIAALVVGSVGTSYAQTALLDTVVVTNYGAAFAGTLVTFKAGSTKHTRPALIVKGTNTLLGASTGPAGVSVSSADGHIAVSVPIDLLDLTGFGAPVGAPAAGTGFAEIFSPGANKNSAPESVIGTRNVAFLVPNTSGVNTPQGLAYEDPFDGVNPGRNILAIANTLPTSFGPIDANAACTAFGGFTVGTITEFDTNLLAVGSPGFNDGVAPFNNSPVCTNACVQTATCPPNPPGTAICPAASEYNATIGGCDTFLLGPVAVAFDESGFLFVVNEAGVASGGPGFVTVYSPGASGDAFPFAIIGLIPTDPTAGAFVDPAKITVASDTDFFDDVMFVTDVGDNSIKIFAPFTNFDPFSFVFTGTELGVVSGGHTKLKRPEGIALGEDSGALYVVNNSASSLSMFTDFTSLEDGGDIPPTLIIQGRNTKLNFPVDVALSEFTPSASPTETSVGMQR